MKESIKSLVSVTVFLLVMIIVFSVIGPMMHLEPTPAAQVSAQDGFKAFMANCKKDSFVIIQKQEDDVKMMGVSCDIIKPPKVKNPL